MRTSDKKYQILKNQTTTQTDHDSNIWHVENKGGKLNAEGLAPRGL